MKIFWSWQSDTPGKTGRHFVRDALAAAIKELKQPEDVEEPTARETKEALHLDHDRKGVAGSPDLVPTILKKIDASAVFVADVTLIAEMPAREGAKPAKKLINSNVAIEYGYALKSVGDESILMVQNAYYGDRDGLPFDLRHKAGPIQFSLAPDASKEDIEKEGAALRRTLVEAFRAYLARSARPSQQFPETSRMMTIASFWQTRDEVLASNKVEYRPGDVEGSDFSFDSTQAFYLRLIPTSSLPQPIRRAALDALARQRPVDVLVRRMYAAYVGRNKYGSIAYEPRGRNDLVAFTQLFPNGEIWGATKEFFLQLERGVVVPIANVRNICRRVLAGYANIAMNDLGVSLPFSIELGAVGLEGVQLGLERSSPFDRTSGPIYENQLFHRYQLDDLGENVLDALIEDFISRLHDLAGIG